MLDGYYNRFDPAKNYDEHLFRAGHVMQSAEVNEIQSTAIHRLKSFGDALFKDGGIVKNAQLFIDSATGAAIGESGIIYLQGQLRGVPRREFTVPVHGEVAVGVYLVKRVVTELEDPSLRDPAIGARNYQEPGAARLECIPQWGYAGEVGAPANAEFYPVYTVIDCVIVQQAPPPQVDAIAQAIASYDRKSAGGYYVTDGLRVTKLDDDPDSGEQQYSIQEGSARIDGQEVVIPAAIRARLAAVPDLGVVDSEPTLADSSGSQRITTAFAPIASIDQVRITAEKTVTLTHGNFTGALDPLPDSAVLELLSAKQGATTYTLGQDFKLTGNQVDWSPTSRPEPAPGSSYEITYRYITSTAPIAPDATGLTVKGAVPNTLIQVSYKWKRPRIDRICLTSLGVPTFVQGVPQNYHPLPPAIPTGLLPLALIYQTWTNDRAVYNDAVRVVPMAELERMNSRIDNLFSLVADQRLLTNAVASDPTSKKGLFVDPFLDDDLRDQGIDQTAAIVNEELTLGIVAESAWGAPTNAPEVWTLPETTPRVAVQQLLQTGAMAVNPYLAMTPLPAIAKIDPAVDFWNHTQAAREDRWLSPVTMSLTEVQLNNQLRTASWAQSLRGWFGWTSQAAIDQRIRERTTIMTSTTQTFVESPGFFIGEAQWLRQIVVKFTLEGFGPSEVLNTVRFDGVNVAFTA